MPNTRVLQRSFAGGEISPEMVGRIDDVKYQTGLAKCRNFIVKPHGPVSNRPGTQFVRAVKDSAKKTRLIPFTYSTTQTMVLELGAGYFRFHTNGATLLSGGVPYEISNPYAEADLMDIHYVQSADVLTLVHPNYPPKELRRLGATNWTLSDISFTPPITAPTNVVANATGFTTAKYFYMYVVTALAADGISESVQSQVATGGGSNISGITQANPGVITTSAKHKLVVGAKIIISGVAGMTQINGTYYVDTVPSETTLTLKTLSGSLVDTTSYGAYTSGGSIQPQCVCGNLNETGSQNTITWNAVSGATRYYIYKYQGGIYGYLGNTTETMIVDDNIGPDMGRTPPTYDTVFAAAGDYPGAVSYFEQRRSFAGTTNQPQNIWMTKSGTENNMSYSLPLKDDDRISVRVAAREANTIRHIVPLSQLILLTSAAEWRVTSINSDAITPSSISVKPQSYIGSSNVQPEIINNSLVYCAARGGHVRELGYNWQASGFITGDLSLRAIHLFDNQEILDMAYSKSPYPLIWFISNSGKLLGLTYVPEQQIGAWHQHDTVDGTFESCAVVSEGNDDILYVVVKRKIGSSYYRYVERLASRAFSDQADAFFVDCGLTYKGVPATTISGLSHIEGQTVNILADGAVHPQRVVSGGQVHLEIPASTVQVGLPIQADIYTLPVIMQMDGFGQGRFKNVNKVWVRVDRASSIFAGFDADNLSEAKQRTDEPYGAPPDLKTQEIQVTLRPSWNDNGQVYVRQENPLPISVLAVTAEVAVGG